MAKAKKVNHAEKAYRIYSKQGQSAVFDYANKNKLAYAPCKPCETNSPIHKGQCLVCGSSVIG